MKVMKGVFYCIVCVLLNYPACTEGNGSKIIDLGLFGQERFNKTSSFKIRSIKDMGYVMGCNLIQVYSKNGDFDVSIKTEIADDLVENNGWYGIFSPLVRRFWSSNNKKEVLKVYCMTPFKDKYILVDLHHFEQEVVIETWLRRLNVTCLVCLISGLTLFFLSGRLSRSVVFYYSSGVGFGILASTLILVFILSRLLPKKQAMYTVLFGGWTICVWGLSLIWKNLTSILLEHYYIVAAYLFVAGFFSFAICYWRGPVADPRTHDIVQWSIQIVSILLIYNGTQKPTVSLSIILAVVMNKVIENHNSGEKLFAFLRILKQNFIFRKLLGKIGDPSPRRLLTEEEYLLEGERETKKALEELRNYCNSPQCSPWKTLSRLESPGRFAQFIEGDHHIYDQEQSLYEEDMQNLTDSENEIENSPRQNHINPLTYKDEYMSEESD
uniref:Nuclear envelope integral membrane protein 1-like n=1 Tax=Phallusia mammillata TaxID=59560 RepID=A0A6F9DN04_9ASCI|nr:nuclear envelope integral membrane protein 1-like [Phallusia mammillata]